MFLVWAGERSAYLAKTTMLRRRLARILRPSEDGGRSLSVRNIFSRIEYWRTASRFESTLLHYALARRHFPEQYLKLTRLRMPAYVRLMLANEFPRTQVTTRISGGSFSTAGHSTTR